MCAWQCIKTVVRALSKVTDSSSSSFLEFFPVETIPSLIPVCQQSLTCQPLNSPRLPTIVRINAVSLSLLYTQTHTNPSLFSLVCHKEKNNTYPINSFFHSLSLFYFFLQCSCFLVLSIFRSPRLLSHSVVSASFPYLHDSRNTLIPTVQVM